jgi:hypothetical protein
VLLEEKLQWAELRLEIRKSVLWSSSGDGQTEG